MATSQNGWPVLSSDSIYLHTWVIPATDGTTKIKLRRGSAGFVLSHLALWFSETIEHLREPILDDWGYAYRAIAGQTTGFSNHASGTACDLNATDHPLGDSGTFSRTEVAAIHTRLAALDGVVRWGGDYNDRKDEMHWEINKSFAETEALARKLLNTPRGERLLASNPGQRAIILS